MKRAVGTFYFNRNPRLGPFSVIRITAATNCRCQSTTEMRLRQPVILHPHHSTFPLDLIPLGIVLTNFRYNRNAPGTGFR